MVGPPPLTGLKVIEFAGLAPGPFAGLLLADAGASVLRIDRPPVRSSAAADPTGSGAGDQLARRKASIAVDLKSARGAALVRSLARHADVLIDPFRPGVLERLGLGPEVLCAEDENPRLIYGRLSGFRRDGRYRDMAGHDINYLAVSGVLALLGRKGERPTPPWNMLADFAGGGAALFQGVLLALAARSTSERGQVVEANMVDGSAFLASYPRFALGTPVLGDAPRGENLLDSGCPFYDTYETGDGGYVAVGALEPQFFAELVKGLGLQDEGREWLRGTRRYDRENVWPEMRREFERVFLSKSRREWEDVFDGTDACVTPVLTFGELEEEEEEEEEGRRRERRGKKESSSSSSSSRREGDQRPLVGLRDTPLLAVHERVDDPAAQGQGPGVAGGGYKGCPLRPGEGGEEMLGRWLGWVRGRDYDVVDGGMVAVGGKNTKSRL